MSSGSSSGEHWLGVFDDLASVDGVHWIFLVEVESVLVECFSLVSKALFVVARDFVADIGDDCVDEAVQSSGEISLEFSHHFVVW